MARVMSLVESYNETLLAAIRKHRDQRGDDRCWLDDEELYSNLPEGHNKTDMALHSPCEMLANCVRFVASRQPDGVPYVSPQIEIERLKVEVATLQAEVKRLEVFERLVLGPNFHEIRYKEKEIESCH